MRVKVIMAGHAGQFFPEVARGVEVEVSRGDTIQILLEVLGVPQELVMFVTCGDRKVDFDYRLCEGDEVCLVSPLMGG